MNTALIVLRKELRESLRDRRTLLNALLVGPFLGPLLFVVIMQLAIGRQLERAELPLPVVVIGAEVAPNLIKALEQSGLQRLPPIANPEAAIRAQTVELVLRITPEFGERWRVGKSAQVELLYDSSRVDTAVPVQRLQGMILRHAQTQAGLRLIARGLSPEVVGPIAITERDQATPQARGAMLFAIVPYFLILTAFLGGMFLAIDATAGERERQSLEPLFINPVQRSHILLGKLLAVSAFGLTSVLLGLMAFTLAGWYLSTSSLNVPVALNLQFALQLIPLMIPLVLLAAILQMLVTAFARSFREAQTWLGLLQLVPAIPLIIVTVLQVKPQLWMYAIPLLGQELAAMQWLRGAQVTPLASMLCVASTLMTVALLFSIVSRIYESERLAIAA